MPYTLHPFNKRNFAKLNPINPATPVIKYFFYSLVYYFHLVNNLLKFLLIYIILLFQELNMTDHYLF